MEESSSYKRKERMNGTESFKFKHRNYRKECYMCCLHMEDCKFEIHSVDLRVLIIISHYKSFLERKSFVKRE